MPVTFFLLLLASCLTFIAAFGPRRTVSSGLSDLCPTDPPQQPNRLQETAIKPPTLLEKAKPNHNKLKHVHERKLPSNTSS
ncbi:hypothetical protein PBY51_009394 [Eleginops maclovinus]|uniref:Secreted protein n=1 Tax=Eleginops maclovinus TaxID=56733 RepID=A0AAN7XRB2_ELEMC|nr:hypothetical protein PBY51_009394 [Eleginops maclovinus]